MSMERDSKALRAAGAGAWEWDIVSDHLEWSNDMFSLLGLDPSRDGSTSDSWNSVVHPEDRQRVKEDVKRALREAISLKGSYRIVHPDGKEAWIGVLGSTEQDERGRTVRMRGICIDVTEDMKAEASLRESQRKYQALVEENVDVIWETDHHGRFTYCSPQMERRWFLRREEILGKTPFDLMPSSEVEKARAEFSRIVLSSDPFIGLRTFAFDGRGDLIYLETNGVPFHDDDGTLLGFRGVTRDITVRERREMNLAFLAQISEGFALLASPEEIVDMVGPRLMERLNITCFFLAEIDAEGDHIIVDYNWQRSPEISQITGIHRLSDFFSEGYRYLARSRSTFVVRDASTDPRIDVASHLIHGIRSYVAIPFQGANKRTYISTVVDDQVHDWREDEIELIQELTNRIVPRIERAEAEKALKASEEGYRHLVQYAPTAICEVDLRGPKFKSVNESLSSLTGYSQEELLAMNPLDLLDEESKGHFRERIQRAMGGGAETSSEYRVVAKDGRRIHAILKSKLRYENGVLVDALVVGHDITDRKHAEEALHWLQRKDELLADVARDLLLSNDPGSIIDDLGERTMRFLDCDLFLNHIADGERGCLRLNAFAGISKEEAEDTGWLEQEDTVCGQVVKDGQMIIVENILDREDRLTEPMRSHGVQAFACHPIIVAGRSIGTLAFGTRERPAFTKEEVAVMRTVTDHIAIALNRIKTERELKESEEKFRTMADGMPAMLWVSNESGEYLFTNKYYREYFDISAEQVAVGKWNRLMHPSDAPHYSEKVHDSLATHKPFFGTVRVRRGDGEWRWLETTATPRFSPSGDFLGYIGISLDVTERIRIEEALKESEVHLARAQQIAKLGSWSWSIDTDEVYWSEETYRILGIGPNEVGPTYKDFTSFVHSDDRKRFEGAICDAMVDGRLDIEYRIVKPSGEERYVHCQGAVTYTGSGHRFKMEGAIQDITERKRLQLELERSNAELQHFAYITSHDLQEPLRMVTTYLSLLEKKHWNELSPAAREYMGFAVEGSVRMRELINGLLKFSRIERMGSKFSMVDMNKIAHMVKDDLKVSINETGAEVIVDPLPTVFADEMQIRQVLQNLISNAIKFHGPETPHIEVSSRSEGPEIVFAVKDNGIGIEPKYHDNLFKMFQRLHTQDEYPGTGIGLAISKKIVERHGGRIWLESDGESGSTFLFSLPKT